MLDALGLEFLARHRDHPLVQRLDVQPIRSQFPSTTAAHVTTMHFGLAVEEHGLYEWRVLEPALGSIICPLRFSGPTGEVEGELEGRLDPTVLAPGPTVYESLPCRSLVVLPRGIESSSFTRLAAHGARVVGCDGLEDGCRAAAVAIQAGEVGYAFVYWSEIDTIGHEYGPSSAEFEGASRAALDAAWSVFGELRRDFTVLFTADHGQVDVSPDRLDYLDDEWPELTSLLTQRWPAGSSRDVFLHVCDGATERVIEELAARLDGRAEVCRATELFERIGPRLEARVGDVAVLPTAGREVWLRGRPAREQWFRGQHGGLTPAETETYLAQLRP